MCDIYLETFAIANVFEFRCMVEAGYEYNTDIHLEPAILEQVEQVTLKTRQQGEQMHYLLFYV